MVNFLSTSGEFAPEWFRSVIEHTPETVLMIDSDGRILYSNRPSIHTSEIGGPSGVNFYQLICADQHVQMKALIRQVFETGLPENIEYMTNGERQPPQWFFAQIGPVWGNGQIVALSLFVHEITSRKQALEEVETSRKDLEKRAAGRSLVFQKYVRHIEAIEVYFSKLNRTQNTSEVLNIFIEQIQHALHADGSAMYRMADSWLEYFGGLNSPTMRHNKDCLDDGSFLRQVIQNDRPIYLSEISRQVEEKVWRNSLLDQKIRSILIVPLNNHASISGLLYLVYRHNRQYSQDDEKLLHVFIEAAAYTIDRNSVFRHLEQQIHYREQELGTLYDIISFTSGTPPIQTLLQNSLPRILKAVECEIGLIQFPPGEEPDPPGMIAVWPQTGIPPEIKEFLKNSPNERQYSTSSLPYSLEIVPTLTEVICLTVPIFNDDQIVSFIRLFGASKTMRAPETIHLVTSAADQLAMAINAIRHRRLAQDAIILEERQRFARNLHDSVTQSLYGLALASDVCKKMVERQDYHRLKTIIEDVTTSSLQALKEMRLMLFELRPVALESEGLIQALKLRLETVERRAGMDASLAYMDSFKVPEYLEVELYHLITEALNNSIRHSEAHSLRVELSIQSRMLIVEMDDDGKGFDPQKLSRGGFGLKSMTERAKKLGGTLSIESEPGKGTHIRFRVKINQTE